jgi:LmbE family N-acetylglucosaminyl deacetylase
MEYAAGVTIADRVMQGDEVSELVFTLGSAGRKSRVYPNSGSSFSTVRLGESILGAKALGIQKLGVITLPGGGLGFEEWLWDGNHPELREVWIGMMRSLNPHTLFSPHPNEKAEQHPDHHAVAVAAQWMTGWGTETDFYAKRYPGSTNNFSEWWRYTTWPGSENVTVTDRTVYTSGDKFDQLKQETLSRFPSQNGIGYAQASRGLNLFQGTTAAVGEGATDRMAEQFNVVRPITARHASWRTL